MSEDVNRVVYWTCEVVLLDARWPNGTPIEVKGRGPTPDEAKDACQRELNKLETIAARLTTEPV